MSRPRTHVIWPRQRDCGVPGLPSAHIAANLAERSPEPVEHQAASLGRLRTPGTGLAAVLGTRGSDSMKWTWVGVRASKWLRGAGCGLLLGWAAWGEERAPALALLLPLLVATRSSRGEAACAAAGYALGLLRFHVAFVARWFDGDVRMGLAVILGCALVSGALWSIGWSTAATVAPRAGRMVLAWLLALVPPAALAVPGHPLVGVGYVLPGAGWLGVAAGAALAAGAGGSARARHPAAVCAFWIAATTALAGSGIANGPEPVAGEVRQVSAISTDWGALAGADEALARIRGMGEVRGTAAVVVWPESVIGRYEPAMQPVLELELLARSRAAGRTQVVGMDLPAAGNRMASAAVAYFPDGSSATAFARQPAPIALWRPWRSDGTFIAQWSASNLLPLGPGERAAVIFCYGVSSFSVQ